MGQLVARLATRPEPTKRRSRRSRDFETTERTRIRGHEAKRRARQRPETPAKRVAGYTSRREPTKDACNQRDELPTAAKIQTVSRGQKRASTSRPNHRSCSFLAESSEIRSLMKSSRSEYSFTKSCKKCFIPKCVQPNRSPRKGIFDLYNLSNLKKARTLTGSAHSRPAGVKRQKIYLSQKAWSLGRVSTSLFARSLRRDALEMNQRQHDPTLGACTRGILLLLLFLECISN